MKKIVYIISLILILLIFFQVSAKPMVSADWWQRPEVRPTQPSTPRELPPQEPTSPPANQPTVAPTNPPTGGTPAGGGGGSKEDPCAAGKSYVGPYCGWSPRTESGGGGGGSTEQPRVGGPQVLGLSRTSSSDVYLSDIIFLAGVLCLVLYAKSKLITDNPIH